jgi:hypothetical protein
MLDENIEKLISGRSAPCIFEVARVAKLNNITDQSAFLEFHNKIIKLWNEQMIQKLEGSY